MPPRDEDAEDFRDTLERFEDFTSREIAEDALEGEEDDDVGTLPG